MDVRVRLSTLWVMVMFNMIYADILGFVTPGSIEGLMTGYSGDIDVINHPLCMEMAQAWCYQ